MPLKDVTVDITLETRPLSRLGFGKPLILGEAAGGIEYQEFRSFDSAVNTLGLVEGDELYKALTAIFSQDEVPAIVAVAGRDTDGGEEGPAESFLDRLAAIIEEDWYFLVTTSTDTNDIAAISDYINGEGVHTVKNKIYGVRYDESMNSDIAAILDTDPERTFFFYCNDVDEYPEAAAIGGIGSKEVGSTTWKNQRLNGVTPVEISAEDLADLHASGAFTFVTKAGVNVTSEGIMGSGEYIDVIHGKDFVQLNMERDVQLLLINQDKVSMTNAGIAQVVSVVESVLKTAFNQGIIAADGNDNPIYTITFPDRNDIPVEDRAARRLPGIDFTFELSGAVHSVLITGTIRV